MHELHDTQYLRGQDEYDAVVMILCTVNVHSERTNTVNQLPFEWEFHVFVSYTSRH